MDLEIILGVVMFTVIVLSLVAVILSARAKLVSTGKVKILITQIKGSRCGAYGSNIRDTALLISESDSTPIKTSFTPSSFQLKYHSP